MVLRYFPEDADAADARSSRATRTCATRPWRRGSAAPRALLVVTGPRSPNAGRTIPMTFDTALAGSGPAGGQPRRRRSGGRCFAERQPFDDVQKSFDTGNPHTAGFALPGVSVTLQTAITRKTATARNVLAYLPATTPVAGVPKPWVAVGAHYDHLGARRHGQLAGGAGRRRQGAPRRRRQRVGHGGRARRLRRPCPRSRGRGTCSWPSGPRKRSASWARTRSSAQPPVPARRRRRRT